MLADIYKIVSKSLIIFWSQVILTTIGMTTDTTAIGQIGLSFTSRQFLNRC